MEHTVKKSYIADLCVVDFLALGSGLALFLAVYS
ncbi:hypothetical protein KIPB_016400, partial [Kipferlia bialata]|eukprot:g16400.t1